MDPKGLGQVFSKYLFIVSELNPYPAVSYCDGFILEHMEFSVCSLPRDREQKKSGKSLWEPLVGGSDVRVLRSSGPSLCD